MTDLNAAMGGIDPVVPPARSTAVTWRYAGEREAADLAYCARFGVAEAPEPAAAFGGGWAYPLPAAMPAA